MTDRSPSRRPPPARRDVLALGVGALILIAAPSIVRADAPYKRTLKLQSLNSGEKLTVTYWTDKGYRAGALKRVRWFMRDLRTGDLAKKLGRGGAGFYPTRTPYAHVDVGPPDAWVYPGMPRPGRDEEYDREHGHDLDKKAG